ncbi:Eco57I restriction-modification methylase domain-containing protein [Novosphingobium flavum]|uniref:Eco57I restriction-modification methylase domain-containing protein n=1 Tax=Novosphingobium aerophilum TaxID=2839843 RepID=UPI001639ED70|nr:DNA methyltransferase [Novosphingobium aerophilum]MBC2660647.1 Eco57I restriction-modification methylase domain-containing protein [Novosphingobium aerophilum]
MAIDRPRATNHLKAFDFAKLFIEELGWDRPSSRQPETVDAEGQQFVLAPVADKRGVRIFHCPAIPERNTRQRIEREITKRAYEHLIIFTDPAQTKQIWQWVAREKGKPAAFREHTWLASIAPDALIQKLDHIAFALSEEEGLTLAGTTLRMRDAFDREKITKRFYEAFKQQHDRFLGFIDGLASVSDRQWYASLMLNRLMFVYFIQKKRFLDGDIDYLKNRLAQVRAAKGTDQFHSFYRAFLLKLFHGGLATAVDARDPETARLLGTIPYLNGGLFEPHALEADGNTIQIADAAFEGVFNFFDQYEWTLDTRPIEQADGKEINPDVLGHIFEKYINQKQMGAYYTKEDITDYITKNTVVPWLFQNAISHDKVAFEPEGYVWRLLSENPDAYIYKSVRHGTGSPLPDNIAAGIDDVAQRTDWNKTAPREFGLPTEIWREVVARRERYEAIRAKAGSGEITRIEDFITCNLDIRQFARDVIQYAESPDLVRAFWKGISSIKILDPACGSGAFLFAALNIQYDLYDACLERMEQFVASAPDSGGGRGQVYSDFRTVLAQVAQHPNRDYFIYKSIIIANLYGVDIMDEAVEICKLRLFLKLASQLENPDQIEPLPDIDFNIRAGNTLIGYTSIADVKKATEATGFDFDDRAGKIEAAAQDLDQAFRLFREQQTTLHGGIEVEHKTELRRRLGALESQLDRFLAKDYGVDVGDDLAASAKFLSWKASHKPFHWLIEFYGIIDDGGFDAVVGNPPYIASNKVGYLSKLEQGERFPDIYAYILLRAQDLTAKEGRCGMIVPLSLTFSEDFSALRDRLRGSAWYSSFDNIPAAVFTGVSQRCTIWISSPNGTDVHVAPMYRWRSAARPHLVDTITFTQLNNLTPGIRGIPKVASTGSLTTLNAICDLTRKRQREIFASGRVGGARLGFSQAARNFVSVFRQDPPCLDANSFRPIASSEIGGLKLVSEELAYASKAALLGELYFSFWLSQGDGFHVTVGVIKDYLNSLAFVEDQVISDLALLGLAMHEQRGSALAFKKNAGKFVGNYNFRSLHALTRRADLILMRGLGLTPQVSLGTFDYAQRVLATNPFAGEKGIPDGLRDSLDELTMVAVDRSDDLQRIDNGLRDYLSMSQASYDFLLNRDVVLIEGVDEGDAE